MTPIPYTRHAIDQSDIDAVTAVLRSGLLTQGPTVAAFEEALAQTCGTRYAVVFSSGTAALHGAYVAAGLSPGDTFVTTPITFAATVNAGVYCGAEPVLCDISMSDYSIDQSQIQITPRTKVVAPVAYAGHPIDIRALHKQASEVGAVVVLDASHALGALLQAEPVCRQADLSVLSFHPAKHVATGEGGAVVTDSADYYEKLLSLRTHGIVKNCPAFAEQGAWYHEMRTLGYNYRLTDIQCALGISQLKRLEASLARRKEIANRYKEELAYDWLTLPPEPPERDRHALHLYPVLVREDRRRFFDHLHANGVLAQVHYIPVHCMPYYKNRNLFHGKRYPVAEEFYEREVSLPMFPTLTDDEQSYVIDVIKRYVP